MAREADEKTALGSVWLRAEPSSTRAPLTREDIVGAAIGILDKEGLDGLSMRRVAVELGTAATSALYWRVATKNDLLELAVDEILAGALVPTDDAGDWRDQLAVLGLAAYEALDRHPWATQLLASHAGLGPNYQTYTARLVEILTTAGFKNIHLDAAVSAVFHYIIGAAVTDAAWHSTIHRSGLPDPTWANAAGQHLDIEPEALTAYLTPDNPAGPTARFTTGLRVILVGLRPRRLS
ncbi:TetR/AcrR family transcriptional regulator C-terminal domain-containing protein [Kribbella italica]|uniref:AcrR family transcriptional regulator n=1 Tax=Kribbella italica TaxID=1540520 RepID=A0A7W9JB41_9ACTN|nr:AcrR family transcriptional regulator [Kribbella italica]